LTTPASIVIPTRARPSYLEVALASIAPQATAAGAELLVIDDAGASAAVAAIAERFGARYEPHPGPLGLNVARNTGVQHSSGELVVFVDDDVEVSPGWLAALLGAAEQHPEVQVFTGPIRPRLEGSRLRSCGREGSPITALDLGPDDGEARYAWGANMTVRRGALERVGPFDVTLKDAGDEQEWQDRLRRTENGRVLYVAAAALDHRRSGRDARLGALARAARGRGRASRRFDAWRGEAPNISTELRTLAGCVGHVLRYRCPAGLTMVAHSVGRLSESLREPRSRAGGQTPSAHPTTPSAHPISPIAVTATRGKAPIETGGVWPANGSAPTPTDDDFLSGESGTVGGLDAIARSIRDEALDAWELASGRRLRLARAARSSPPTRRVLVLGIERPERGVTAATIGAELLRSRHAVELHRSAPGELGKFENLNRLLAAHPAEGHDWLLVIDDDIVLPHGFLDRLLFLAERFGLDLAQPTHRYNSHAAWQVTRRRTGSLVRETPFVEIGPVTAFASSTFSTLLPFPPLRMGWGLDMHWGALAREHGWRCGVVDALAVGHRIAPAGDAYSRETAVAEARAFLAEHPYLRAREAQRTLATHRRW
jgi:GT2 family glycosyltransferase